MGLFNQLAQPAFAVLARAKEARIPLRERRRLARCALRSRPYLETLETRLAPANVFVVPFSQPLDSSHQYLLSSAIQNAGPGGVVTIEPGATAEAGEIQVAQRGITIQGDPNVPASSLPTYTLLVEAGNVRLTNLNLLSVRLGLGVASFSHNLISKCRIYEVQVGHNVGSVVSQNDVTGSISMLEATDTVITNNTIHSLSPTLVSISESIGTTVRDNTLVGAGSAQAIKLDETVATAARPTTIANNSITADVGIVVNQAPDHLSNIDILNNRIDTGGGGAGLVMHIFTSGIQSYRIVVQGNDFKRNDRGVTISGTNMGSFIDLGGGAHGSLGGNNFHGFDNSQRAIAFVDSVGGSLVARHNIFTSGVDPNATVLRGEFATIDVTEPLSDEQAFVQTLYNRILGRTGMTAELDLWVAALAAQGQAAVANGIFKSPESLGRSVDQLYLRFLGRASDAGGRSGWVSFLRAGGTLEQVETLFLSSPEYIGHINTDFVQSLYLNILGRVGNSDELASWNNNISSLGGLPGIANLFVRSTENRLNALRTDFVSFLDRRPSNAAILPLANTSLGLLDLRGVVLSSPEFFMGGCISCF